MAKANGWYAPAGAGTRVGVAQGNGVTVSGASTHLPKYLRSTELRRVEDNDIYRLATILDVNACWRKLMSIIPKGLDVQAASAAGALNYHEIAANGGLKYSAQDISLIDGVAERLPPDQSISQVMIDEWKTSGKLNERPTVGVLLQLLVQAELYSAADFVALDFLSESKPERPADGPAAHISLDLTEDLEEDMDVDNEQPGSLARNLDYFDKHIEPHDKSVPQPLVNERPPTAPTRSSRQLRSNITANSSNQNPMTGTTTTRTTTTTATTTGATAGSASTSSSIPNVPNLTILNLSEQIQEAQQHLQSVPNLSILNPSTPAAVSATTATSSSVDGTSNGISLQSTDLPRITLLIENSAEIGSSPPTTSNVAVANLPEISALNLNTQTQQDSANSSSSTNSLSNEEDDDDDDDEEEDDPDADNSLPNLSNSEHQNSNNDSSLTTVTGTSGDNSFELTNDSSSASNEDYASNIPNLSELQP
ncbi:uncharacterized protein Dwil_GK13530 [Drosophila willistoni]|uniref:Death domain-containing protein n=1 Tax=Drosophila willistoni TaxID=7260 RepID=B4NID7_DROWI|nr:protein Tube [Drosophila willistoni]EDW83719.1 uncharacterized protein Dwil_GK13530 [Drosophila willistoni]